LKLVAPLVAFFRLFMLLLMIALEALLPLPLAVEEEVSTSK